MAARARASAAPTRRLPVAWRVRLIERLAVVAGAVTVALLVCFCVNTNADDKTWLDVRPQILSCGAWLAAAVLLPTDACLRDIRPWIFSCQVTLRTVHHALLIAVAGQTIAMVPATTWWDLVGLALVHAFKPDALWLYSRLLNCSTLGLLLVITAQESRTPLVKATVVVCCMMFHSGLRPSTRMWLSQKARLATVDVALRHLQANDVREVAATYAASAIALPKPPRPDEEDDESEGDEGSMHSGSMPKWSATSPILHGNFSWTWHSDSLASESSTSTRGVDQEASAHSYSAHMGSVPAHSNEGSAPAHSRTSRAASRAFASRTRPSRSPVDPHGVFRATRSGGP